LWLHLWDSQGIYLEELRKTIKTRGQSMCRLRFELYTSIIQLTGITTKANMLGEDETVSISHLPR
jgi:hypothetical protein